jgi:predicted cupin superfamily sugar epimerase
METQGSQFVEYELHVMEEGKLTFFHFLNIEVNSELSSYQLDWINKKFTSMIKHTTCKNCIFYNQKALVQCAVKPNRDFENYNCIEKVAT